MAGHSKWANIKHRKAAQDNKRGKIYTKLRRKIVIAVQKSGPNPDDNASLRDAIAEARNANMPKNTIDRAIKSASGDNNDARLEEVRYEGYGTAGVAVLVECLTDNFNRTVAEVRHTFAKYGGNMGTEGSVAYLFEKKGILNFAPGTDEEKVMEIALEAGAEDIKVDQDDQSIEVFTASENFSAVLQAFTNNGFTPESAEISMIASTTVELNKEDAEKILRLSDILESLDDVQEVYTNAEINAEVLSQLNESE
ncbi:MAG: hypothetical protein A3F17_08360 [Gammaproteobacteria bacterium RIFCSPHIGHO2_12_FULL_41_15]|nr:MAG: hypothetical protein A3F17_08360 [Gammaproteobacteria bacterium RIFCSPHIGHO2_12_FULL_41_15]